MASKLFVKLRAYIGVPLAEIYLRDSGNSGDPILMNVTIIEVGSDYVVVNQPGSGGLGEVIIPLQSIVACIEF
ncbi:hypothetical protein ABFG93_03415 [Pseudalkalibacillus hwajinpoensis]|uniref:hypothetical protein n=1 Tax=Guptibacillus hwajinpoensis TaxID=208199 RepID=UPI00325BC038